MTLPPADLETIHSAYQQHGLEGLLPYLDRLTQHVSTLEQQLTHTTRTAQRWQSLFDHTTDAVLLIDPTGRIVEANPRAALLFGSQQADMLGAALLDYVMPDAHAQARQQMQRVLAAGHLTPFTCRFRRMDGTGYAVEVNATLIQGATPSETLVQAIIRDITAHKELQQKHAIISEVLSDYVFAFEVTAEGAIVPEWVAGDIEAITGYAIDTFARFEDWHQIIYPNDLLLAFEHFQRVLGGQSDTVEYRIINRAQEIRWLRTTLKPQWDENAQRLVRLIGVSKDITPEKTARHDLLTHAAQSAVIAKSTKVGIWDWQPHKDYFLWGGNITAILGYAEGELRNTYTTFMTLVHPDDRLTLLESFEQVVVGTLDEVLCEHRMQRKDGGWCWFATHGLPTYSTAGEVVRIVGSSIDITAQKQATAMLETLNQELEARVEARTAELHAAKRQLEQRLAELTTIESALGESEDRFTKAFHAAALPMTIATRRQGTYLEVNQSFLNTFEYTREAVIGKTALDLHLMVDVEAFWELTATLKATGRVVNHEIRMRTQSGKVRECVAGVEFIEVGGVECVLAIVTDLTDYNMALRNQERIQQQLFHADRLLAVGKLAASIAHEMNNPLQAVYGALNLALKDMDRQHQVRQYISISLAEVERMMNIVRHMREMHQTGTLQKKALDLNALVDDVGVLVHKKLQEQRITFHQQLAPDLPAIMGVCEQIRQVLLNLMMNAIEAMPHGGTLTVRTFPDLRGRWVHLTVSDTGHGFTEPQRAFEPFYTTKEKGLGLGLAIVEQIVERHHGQISIEPQAMGACVHVRLAVQPEAPMAK